MVHHEVSNQFKELTSSKVSIYAREKNLTNVSVVRLACLYLFLKNYGTGFDCIIIAKALVKCIWPYIISYTVCLENLEHYKKNGSGQNRFQDRVFIFFTEDFFKVVKLLTRLKK
ncbi:hypothetical protein BpHYR1_018171 [Brachionus plicatilis]|uniref:Uncharacterized protein n=1 Tax=Brachionus plicatilis TaxID=10195 RepID=A0A3M7SHA0_BRAPC|nr:hypothetical protein BpHYR1_018171 [Brachionus plicatilis]